MLFAHYLRHSFIIPSVIWLLGGCQSSRLQVKEEKDTGGLSASHTIEKSREMVTPIQQSIQQSQKISPSDQSNEKPDATAQQEDVTELKVYEYSMKTINLVKRFHTLLTNTTDSKATSAGSGSQATKDLNFTGNFNAERYFSTNPRF